MTNEEYKEIFKFNSGITNRVNKQVGYKSDPKTNKQKRRNRKIDKKIFTVRKDELNSIFFDWIQDDIKRNKGEEVKSKWQM